MSRTKRLLAASLALLFLSQVVAPTTAWALSSGPSQPEVEGFTPASATNMVDLFTGDMSYNIPLLDVEGYPVNLAYNAGVGMDQEASWVGLGWNLSAGQVERNMRGIPDDFRGDRIVRHLSMKPNRTVGVNFNMGFQLFSTPIIGANLSLGASPSYNNYNGFAQDLTVNFSLRSARENKPSYNAGLGLTSSSNGALRVTPSVGFDSRQNKVDKYNTSAGINFGVSIDSRQGLTNLSFGTSMDVSRKTSKTTSVSASSEHGTSFDVGAPTYSPQIGLPMVSRNMSFSYTLGAATQGGHPNMTLGGFFSEQKLATNIRSTPSYGFLHLHAGQSDTKAQLDHNREKDGPYSGDRPAFGIASLTNDVFTVSSQGVSGSYRPFRSEVGHVFDPSNGSISSGGSGGVDVGSGMLAHGGARLMVNYSLSKSGKWGNGTNQAAQRLSYHGLPGRDDLEAVYFREANEATVDQDPTLWSGLRGDEAVRFTLPRIGAYAHRLGAQFSNGAQPIDLPSRNYRDKREPRGQLFSYLNAADAEHFALEEPIEHDNDLIIPPHHMSEVTVLDQQGGRHVFGIPAYNVSQADVEFAVEDRPIDAELGLAAYTAEDNSIANSRGRDEFYSRTETPPYAYAFLLTAMLSNDYSDADDVRGPSDGDLGTYTRFEYAPVHDAFPWRTPAIQPFDNGPPPGQAPQVYAGMGRFIEGSPTSELDDKCTYSYGEKEVYYLDTIVTRNYIAVFHRSHRDDAQGVKESGLIDNTMKLEKLDRISLYEKRSYLDNPTGAIPIKEVHFRYDYSLCPGTPNSAANSGGKLTLRRVFFTYGASRMGVTSPYVFNYSDVNPSYSSVSQDRWGNYQAEQQGLQNDDFPYTAQEEGVADAHAEAWKLDEVLLPSGGRISIVYEADDYANVQDRPAMQMMRILDITSDANPPTAWSTNPKSVLSTNSFNDFDIKPYHWFDLPDGDLGMDDNALAEWLVGGIDMLYFRYRMKMKDEHLPDEAEFVSGYAPRPAACGVVMMPGTTDRVGYVRMTEVAIDEESMDNTSPIYRAALEFLRVNHPEWIAPEGTQQPDDGAEGDMGNSYLMSVVSSSTTFMTGLANFFQGPNREVHNAHDNDYCHWAIMGQSYIRLNHPLRTKKGGGYRVATVAMADAWEDMEQDEEEHNYTYTQRYTYGDENGSWGVAAFEPMMGADENPFRKPVYYQESRTLSPDERFYQEEPFGECFFPRPVVGYSRVEVVDHIDDQVIRAAQGTGRVVHEFYTAREFPTITSRTGILPARRSNQPNLLSLLGIKKVDHMHGTQGFVVETNDMHGKPKRTAAYPQGPEDSDVEVSYVEYKYASAPYGSASRVVSLEQTIDPQGNVNEAEIGRDFEFVADTREFTSLAKSGGADVKFELLYSAVAGIPIPLVLPKRSSESTAFRTGVFVKKIHRFGRLRETVKMENGSRVSTENLAYDAITGQVLVTRTANDFKDPIYSMTFPAYWHYPGMAPAYRNIGSTITASVDGSSKFSHATAHALFTPGDELALWHGSTPMRAWVDRVDGNSVTLTQRTAEPVPAADYRMTVVRSGHRNMPGVPMMELTTLSNPLLGVEGNVYANIVNAKAVEFGTEWPTECECLEDDPQIPDMNEWVINRKGVWRLGKEHTWLTDRTRSVTNANTNIRRDGVYGSFDPYYKVANGLWEKDETGWTTTRRVMLYSNNGQELENHDALNIFSSVHVGYRGTLVKSVAKNARYRENGFDGFEDYDYDDCADRHFRVAVPAGGVIGTDAHTGRRSIRVTASSPAQLTPDYDNPPCQVGCKSWFLIGQEGPDLKLFVGASNAQGLTAEVDPLSNVQFIPTDGGFLIQGVIPWSAYITITDGEGCTQTKLITYP